MRHICLRPGDRVTVYERRGAELVTHRGLMRASSMDEALAGTHGEPGIQAVFVYELSLLQGMLRDAADLVHVSHKDWMEGRVGMAYELPEIVRGMCRYCECTDTHGCAEGCSWLDFPMRTVCSAEKCAARYEAEFVRPLAQQMHAIATEIEVPWR